MSLFVIIWGISPFWIQNQHALLRFKLRL